MKNSVLIGASIIFLAALGAFAYLSIHAPDGPEASPSGTVNGDANVTDGNDLPTLPTANKEAVQEAVLVWIKTVSPTYVFDGSNLKLVSLSEQSPDTFLFVYSFDSNHGGYGDRSGTMITQVITPHTMEVVYENGAVRSAMTDKTFNELAAVQMRTRKIELFYYNAPSDKDADDNVGCSQDAVLPVDREIPVTQSPIKDVITLLLKGEVTAAEKKQGFSTEFPNAGFSLISANLKNGTLTLTFRDENNFTSGGSCRVGILAAQVTKTALQFPEVKKVIILPEELFQP